MTETAHEYLDRSIELIERAYASNSRSDTLLRALCTFHDVLT